MTKRTALIAAFLGACCSACDPRTVSPVTEDPDGGDGGSECQVGVVTLATGKDLLVAAMAVDETSVYWNADRLHRTPICGGITTLVPNEGAAAMTIDATNLYETNGSGVFQVPLAGGVPILLSTDTVPMTITVDATHVYWIVGKEIRKVPIGGGETVTIATDTFAGPIPTIAVDATSVYWSNGSAIRKVPLEGGTPTTLVSSQNLGSMALDADHVYWSDHDNTTATSRIARVPIEGGEPIPISTDDAEGGLRVDETHVYYLSGARVRKVPKDGSGPAESLFVGGLPTSFVIDATSLYWTDANDETVKKLTPK